MNCTSCKQGKLIPNFLEPQLRSHACNHCGGDWLLVEDYVAWKENNPEFTVAEHADFEIEDTQHALLCPATGAIMHKYHIANDSDHKLDYSPRVGGIWMDKGEWTYLKLANLAGSLNRIFTDQWQQAIRTQSARETFEDIYQERFGEDDYRKARDVREWLRNNANRADLRAYILAEDPYSAVR
ncbi:zf-TFIIB domain-containing protein [Marinobacter sp. JSM 1782161]|uniref:TFIIB-type zinc ribbon-containing protein n=1 Tax=Marinobacter sp. JSM 1782161 TaxID=2685906 RepID=UPI0014041CDC|nr:zf-TFIIB domain-containing protein [Marinobacter sp. JSM 1782161]